MKIEAAVREYLIEIEVGKHTPRTIKGYQANLNLFLCFCKEKSMIEDVEDISLGVVKQLTKLLSEKGKRARFWQKKTLDKGGGTYVQGLMLWG